MILNFMGIGHQTGLEGEIFINLDNVKEIIISKFEDSYILQIDRISYRGFNSQDILRIRNILKKYENKKNGGYLCLEKN